jgi:hypothetical protein
MKNLSLLFGALLIGPAICAQSDAVRLDGENYISISHPIRK